MIRLILPLSNEHRVRHDFSFRNAEGDQNRIKVAQRLPSGIRCNGGIEVPLTKETAREQYHSGSLPSTY